MKISFIFLDHRSIAIRHSKRLFERIALYLNLRYNSRELIFRKILHQFNISYHWSKNEGTMPLKTTVIGAWPKEVWKVHNNYFPTLKSFPIGMRMIIIVIIVNTWFLINYNHVSYWRKDFLFHVNRDENTMNDF